MERLEQFTKDLEAAGGDINKLPPDYKVTTMNQSHKRILALLNTGARSARLSLAARGIRSFTMTMATSFCDR